VWLSVNSEPPLVASSCFDSPVRFERLAVLDGRLDSCPNRRPVGRMVELDCLREGRLVTRLTVVNTSNLIGPVEPLAVEFVLPAAD